MIYIKVVLRLLFIHLLIKQSSGRGSGIKQNEELAEELHKPVIRKFYRRRIYSSFKEYI